MFVQNFSVIAAGVFVLAACQAGTGGEVASPAAPAETKIAALLAVADEDAAASPASVHVASRFSRSVASGAATALAPSSDLLPELSRTVENLIPSDEELLTFDASSRPVGFSEAIAAALQNDVNIALAAERINEADARRINAVFGYLPRVSAKAGVDRLFQNVIDTDNAVFQAGTAEFNVVSASAEARQPLIDFARLLSIRAADVGKTVSEAAYVASAQASAFTAATVFLQGSEAQAKIDGAKARLAVLDQQSQAEAQLVDAGLGTPTGGQLIAVEKGAIQVELLEYEEDLSLAQTELGRLIGQPVERFDAMDVPEGVFMTAGRETWETYLDAALRENASLKQLRLETLQKREEYHAQFAEDFAPTVEIFARAEYEDRGASRFGGGSETNDYTIGVEAKIPLFNANGNGYLNVEEESQLRQAILSEAGQRRALESEIRALVARMAKLRESIARSDEAALSAEALLASAQRGADLGLSSEILIMRQEVQRIQAATWAERSRLGFLRSWVRLSFLTGEPLSPGGAG